LSDDLATFFKPSTPRAAENASKPGILYAEDFSDLRGAAKPAKTLAPSFNDEDLRAARAEGFAAGMEAARSDQTATLAALRQACLQSLEEEFSRQRGALLALGEERAHEIAEVLCAMLAASLPEFCASHGETEIAALMRKIVPGLHPAAHLKVKVHPSIKEEFADDLAVFEVFETKPIIEGDAKLGVGDVKMIWENGRAMRDTATIIAEVRATLTAFGLCGSPDQIRP